MFSNRLMYSPEILFDLSSAVPVMLIKMKLLRDLTSLQSSSFLYDRLPKELVDKIRKLLVGTIIARNKTIMNATDQGPLIRELKSQLEELFKFVKFLVQKIIWQQIHFRTVMEVKCMPS